MKHWNCRLRIEWPLVAIYALETSPWPVSWQIRSCEWRNENAHEILEVGRSSAWQKEQSDTCCGDFDPNPVMFWNCMPDRRATTPLILDFSLGRNNEFNRNRLILRVDLLRSGAVNSLGRCDWVCVLSCTWTRQLCLNVGLNSLSSADRF